MPLKQCPAVHKQYGMKSSKPGFHSEHGRKAVLSAASAVAWGMLSDLNWDLLHFILPRTTVVGCWAYTEVMWDATIRIRLRSEESTLAATEQNWEKNEQVKDSFLRWWRGYNSFFRTKSNIWTGCHALSNLNQDTNIFALVVRRGKPKPNKNASTMKKNKKLNYTVHVWSFPASILVTISQCLLMLGYPCKQRTPTHLAIQNFGNKETSLLRKVLGGQQMYL